MKTLSATAIMIVTLLPTWSPAQEAAPPPQIVTAASAVPSPGKSLVYVYRDSSMAHAVYYDHIFANGTFLADLHRSEFVGVELPPGKVAFAGSLQRKMIPIGIDLSLIQKAVSKAKGKLTIDVSEGKTYYVKYSLHASGSKMELVDADAGAREVGNLHLAKTITK